MPLAGEGEPPVARPGSLRFANAPKSLLISARAYMPGCQFIPLILLAGANPSPSSGESPTNRARRAPPTEGGFPMGARRRSQTRKGLEAVR